MQTRPISFLTLDQEKMFLKLLNNADSNNIDKCKLNYELLKDFVMKNPDLLNHHLPSFYGHRTVFGTMSASKAGRFIILSNPPLAAAIHHSSWHTGANDDKHIFIKCYLNDKKTYRLKHAPTLFLQLDPADLNRILEDGQSVPYRIISMLQRAKERGFGLQNLPNIFANVTDDIFLHGDNESAASALLNTHPGLRYLSMYPELFARIPDTLLKLKSAGCAKILPDLLKDYPLLADRFTSMPCSLSYFLQNEMCLDPLLRHPEWLDDAVDKSLTLHDALRLLMHPDGCALLLMSQSLRSCFTGELLGDSSITNHPIAWQLLNKEQYQALADAFIHDGVPLEAIASQYKDPVQIEGFDEGHAIPLACRPRRGVFGWFDRHRAKNAEYQRVEGDSPQKTAKR